MGNLTSVISFIFSFTVLILLAIFFSTLYILVRILFAVFLSTFYILTSSMCFFVVFPYYTCGYNFPVRAKDCLLTQEFLVLESNIKRNDFSLQKKLLCITTLLLEFSIC